MRVTFNKALPTTMTNLADVLNSATYATFSKGKWHLSFAKAGGDNWGCDDPAWLETQYRIKGWNPPDAGNFLSVGSTLGGGTWNNDDRFVTGVAHNGQPAWGTGALDFLTTARTPFCLVVSLVNPHDVFLYPDANGGDSNTKTAKYAVCFDASNNFEYEMYDLSTDPGEMTNLLFGTPSSSALAMWKELHGTLTTRLKSLGAFPQDATWPTTPWST